MNVSYTTSTLKENVTKSTPTNALETWVGSTRLSWIRFTCLLSLIVLFLKFFLKFAHFHFHGEEIELGIRLVYELGYEPVLIAYVLSSWIFIVKPLLEKAIKNLKILIKGDFDQLITDKVPLSHRSLRLQFTITSGVMGVLLFDLQKFLKKEYLEDVVIYSIIDFLIFAVLGYLLYRVLAGVKLITMLVRQTTTTNIFDPTPFQPVAQWSLAVSLAIVGGIIINLLFRMGEALGINHLIVYAIFLVVAVVVFLIGMWSTHRVMRENKRREINKFNEQLLGTHNELLICLKKGLLKEADSLLSVSSKLHVHKQILEKANEWPYTAGNVRSLSISIFVPVIISIIKRLFS